ncbi:hypothetical protein CVIRNUC_004336 [Coccomyxa viridis]|uniref:Uncharacterized protein n=2 Tax=Coccomyxa viridis TaxID=1274662 RepID=A0AAV1I2U4_9CHLO|nr:hypothetical protein CVIRNUC_004336 [Coccomyxa viridis]
MPDSKTYRTMDKARSQAAEAFADCIPEEAVQRLEAAVYDNCRAFGNEEGVPEDSPLFTRMYLSKCRQVKDNIDPDSYIGNVDLRAKVLDGSIDIRSIPGMSPAELFPGRWSNLMEEKRKRDEVQYNYQPTATSGRYLCKRCGSRKISYYELQTRSADEGTSSFFTCIDCGAKWTKH